MNGVAGALIVNAVEENKQEKELVIIISNSKMMSSNALERKLKSESVHNILMRAV